jgi:hypothetical protein
MKICLTGWNGFLSSKLREKTDVVWTEEAENTDALFLMGSPTFTDPELSQHDAQVMHQYVRETIKKVDRYNGHIIFASTTGVDDIQLDHGGSTSYNLGKLYLENYILNEADSCTILRIGTIVSDKISDVNLMKPDRIQPMLYKGYWPLWEDKYLLINDFVNITMNAILTKKQGIVEYPLTSLNLAQLKLLAK